MYTSLEKYTELQTRASNRILNLLDRIDLRNRTTYSLRRSHARLTFRGQVTLIIYEETNDKPAPQEIIQVWARSLSQSGFSFIHPGSIKPRSLLVGLPVEGAEQSWFRAEIMRAQEIPQEEFWEFGVRFCGRVADPAAFLTSVAGSCAAWDVHLKGVERRKSSQMLARELEDCFPPTPRSSVTAPK